MAIGAVPKDSPNRGVSEAAMAPNYMTGAIVSAILAYGLSRMGIGVVPLCEVRRFRQPTD